MIWDNWKQLNLRNTRLLCIFGVSTAVSHTLPQTYLYVSNARENKTHEKGLSFSPSSHTGCSLRSRFLFFVVPAIVDPETGLLHLSSIYDNAPFGLVNCTYTRWINVINFERKQKNKHEFKLFQQRNCILFLVNSTFPFFVHYSYYTYSRNTCLMVIWNRFECSSDFSGLLSSSSTIQRALFGRFSLFPRPQLPAGIPAVLTSSATWKWALFSGIRMRRRPGLQVVWQTIWHLPASTGTCFERSGIWFILMYFIFFCKTRRWLFVQFKIKTLLYRHCTSLNLVANQDNFRVLKRILVLSVAFIPLSR